MFTGLNVFKMAYAMSTHAGQRQAVIAKNIANADTPEYRAKDIESFQDSYATSADTGMRASRAGHIDKLSGPETGWSVHTPDAPLDPNGNSVSVELEILKSVETKRQHDRALAIYRSSMNVLRTSLGRG